MLNIPPRSSVSRHRYIRRYIVTPGRPIRVDPQVNQVDPEIVSQPAQKNVKYYSSVMVNETRPPRPLPCRPGPTSQNRHSTLKTSLQINTNTLLLRPTETEYLDSRSTSRPQFWCRGGVREPSFDLATGQVVAGRRRSSTTRAARSRTQT